jgi:hypothetical protein
MRKRSETPATPVSPVVERPAESDDAQQSTPQCVGERPSKSLSRNALMLRQQRDTLINMKKKGESQ